ncbi:MAG: hypothetical protein P1P84_22330 [Deferrisomatales bacterium]|nr:hypothetical protein [Deferrisomatales bacterium]
MFMQTLRKVPITAVLAILALCPVGCSQHLETTRDSLGKPGTQAQEVTTALAEMRTRFELTTGEAAAMEPALLGYRISEGDLQEAGEMVRYAVSSDCREECLTEMIVAMHRARERGIHSKQAREMVANALASERMVVRDSAAAALSPREFAQATRTRFDGMLYRQETLHRPELAEVLTDLAGNIGLTEDEARGIEAPLLGYIVGGGDVDQMRLALSAAVSTGCRGACLEEVACCMNGALERGVPCREARSLLTRAVRDEMDDQADRVAKRSEDELAAGVKQRMAQYVAER